MGPIVFGAMFRTLMITAVVVMLGGCGAGLSFSSGTQAEATVGWYCVDNAETGIKDCEKRLLRNGVPVNDVVYERLGAVQPSASESGMQGESSPLTVINALDDGGGLQVENQGPAPREVRAYVDRSGKDGDSVQSGDL